MHGYNIYVNIKTLGNRNAYTFCIILYKNVECKLEIEYCFINKIYMIK